MALISKPANAIITPKNGPQMKPIFNRNLKKNRQNCHPHCNFYPQKRPANGTHILAHFQNNSRTAIPMTTVIPITTKRSTKTARKWHPRFSAFFLFSKQLPNSHLYDYRHPFNHRKVYQNDPPNDPTFCARFHILYFKTIYFSN